MKKKPEDQSNGDVSIITTLVRQARDTGDAPRSLRMGLKPLTRVRTGRPR